MNASTRSLNALFLTLLLGACSPAGEPPAETAALEADVLFINGHILTLDDADTVASTLVVTGERIAAVGGADLAERYQAATTIDLAGTTLMPGFIDSHTHINGRPPHFIDLTEVTSVAEIVLWFRRRPGKSAPVTGSPAMAGRRMSSPRAGGR